MDIKEDLKKVLEKLKNHPSSLIKAQYLRRFENKGPADPAVQKLQKAACIEEPLMTIQADRNKEGWWYASNPGAMYKKYQGTSWTLLFAATLGAPPDHSLFRDSCKYFMDKCYVEKIGAFESDRRASRAFTCFTAHASYFLTYFGFFSDERVQNAFKWLASNLGIDGGMNCFVMEVMLNPTCVMVLPKFLKAAQLLRENERKELLRNSVSKAVQKLLDVKIDHYQPVEVTRWNKDVWTKSGKEIRKMKSEMKLSGQYKQKKSWTRFQFPLHYDSDLLEVLITLGRLGIKKNRILQGTAERIYKLRENDGSWKAKRTLNGKMWKDIKYQDDWITLRAIEALMYYY